MATPVDDAAEALRNSPLYVDPAAEATFADLGVPFDDDDQSAARATLNAASTPIMIAVLPSDTDGSAAAEIARAVNRSGSYVIMIPPDGDTVTVSDTLADAHTAAQNAGAGANNVGELIDNIVARFEELPPAEEGGAGSGSADGSGGGLLPLAILAAAGGGGFLLYRRNKRNRERAQLEQVRGALEEDITAYGEQLSTLDLDVAAASSVPAEAQQEYARALDLYEQAKTHAGHAEKPGDLRRVTHALEEGRWLLRCVEARINHEPVPQRRLPCFFDPRHGPSVDEVEWAPAGGVPRAVPACAADVVRIRSGADPDIRMVDASGGMRRPYWEAGPAYGGWAGGYFGGLLPGMLVGTMLGSAMSGPMYMDGGGFGGGDSGGDFGGGFGGGDFGGGFGGFGGGFGD